MSTSSRRSPWLVSLITTVAVALIGILRPVPNAAAGATRYVAVNGTDSGGCTSASSPCRTITYGVSQLAAGDTLIVGNGTYTEPNAIRNVPSGNAGPDGTPGTGDDVYTTVRAETDFGVLIDGKAWQNNYVHAIRLENKSYIAVRGFRIHLNQQTDTNGTVGVYSSHHIKIIRCGFGYAGISGNVAALGIGPSSDYVLVEESYAFGGGRYMFLNYWGDHTVMRRNVARNDYWTGSLQSAAFTNYDSVRTVWQNNIAINSDESCCSGHLYAGFWNENKSDHAADTSQEFHGNIVLDYGTFYAAHLDWGVSGTRTLSNNIWWDSNGGYWGAQGDGTTASWPSVRNLTSGGMTGTYDGPNDGAARGTGISIYQNLANSVTHSIFANNRSYGVADYVNGNYNAFSGNGSNYGGNRTPSAGANDITNHSLIYNVLSNPTGSLKHLPRGPEPGSVLAGAGQGGSRVGAEVMWKIGLDGTLWGEPGWNVVRSPENGYGRPEDRLWPWPNEAIIKADMAAYKGGGLAGPRGFAASGNGLYGGPKTLTSYIWEYLGNPCPSDICGGSGGGGSEPPASPTNLRIISS